MDDVKDLPLSNSDRLGSVSLSHLCTLPVDMVLCFPCVNCDSIIGIYPFASPPACAQLSSSSRLSYVAITYHTLCKLGISYTTPFFLTSGVGVFTLTRDSLRVLGNLNIVHQDQCQRRNGNSHTAMTIWRTAPASHLQTFATSQHSA